MYVYRREEVWSSRRVADPGTCRYGGMEHWRRSEGMLMWGYRGTTRCRCSNLEVWRYGVLETA